MTFFQQVYILMDCILTGMWLRYNRRTPWRWCTEAWKHVGVFRYKLCI